MLIFGGWRSGGGMIRYFLFILFYGLGISSLLVD